MSESSEGKKIDEDVSPLNMSDEELENMAFPETEDPAPEEDDDADTDSDNDGSADNDDIEPEVDEEDDADDSDDEDEDPEEDAEDDEEPKEEEEDPEEEPEEDDDKSSDDGGKKDETGDDEDPADDGKDKDGGKDKADPDKATGDVDYKSEYDRLLAPFKANGKDMQVQSVDDALTLMKMGANYNKKMAGLKPNLKLMKMLENNKLLNEEKLSYLIDLDRKDPEAIAKLLKDSGINPLDVDVAKDTEYKPGTYTVDDKEVELDSVLDDIRESGSFKETIDIISNKWDDSSKKVVLADPGIIKVINEQVGNGIYAKIMTKVESEKMLGRLTELSDLEAYKAIGDVIQSEGGFDQVGASDNKPSDDQDAKTVKKALKAKIDPKLNEKRRAASSTKGGGNKRKKAVAFDPLALSDEDFEKASASYAM